MPQELFVSLYGEVQKEVIQATLANDFGIDVEFRETTTICIERPIGTGAAVEIMRKAPNPFRRHHRPAHRAGADQFRRRFRLEVELGSIPLAFHKAVEDTVQETLHQGLYGWQVTDCMVTMTHSGYSSLSSTAADFRLLTPLVLMSALKQAGTQRVRADAPLPPRVPGRHARTLSAACWRGCDAVPQTPVHARRRRACWRARFRRRGCTSCSSNCRR